VSQASGHLEETKSGVSRPSPSRITSSIVEDEVRMQRKAFSFRSRGFTDSRNRIESTAAIVQQPYTSSDSIDASDAFPSKTEAIARELIVTELFSSLLKHSDRRGRASQLRAAR
jgi:hypothetical protein